MGQLASDLMLAYRTACSLGMLMHYSVTSGPPICWLIVDGQADRHHLTLTPSR